MSISKMTFSLASLILIFAFAFITTPAMAQAPSVSSISITTNPSNGDTYRAGETITVRATFTANVDVAGSGGTPETFPTIDLDVGGEIKKATTAANTSQTTHNFSYIVVADDEDTDGVSVAAGAIDLNGGTIYAAGATTTPAVLTHDAIVGLTNEKVDAVLPAVESAAITSTGPYKAGDKIQVTVTFNEQVNLDSSANTAAFHVLLRVGFTNVEASYVSGFNTAAGKLIFEYTVVADDEDANGVEITTTDLLGQTGLNDGATPPVSYIRDIVDNAAVADGLSVPGSAGGDTQKVDNTAPVVTAADVTGAQSAAFDLEFTVADATLPSAAPYGITVVGSPDAATGKYTQSAVMVNTSVTDGYKVTITPADTTVSTDTLVTFTITATDGVAKTHYDTATATLAARTESDNTAPVVTATNVTGAQSAAFDLVFNVVEANLPAATATPPYGIAVVGSPDAATGKYTQSAVMVNTASGTNAYKVTVTPTANVDMAETPVTFTITATDTSSNSASATATATLAARGTIRTFEASYNALTKTTNITSGEIAAHGFVVIEAAALPDLHYFFNHLGLTITLDNGDNVDDKNLRTVVISEILWGYDDRLLGDARKKYQFIELYNATNAAISLAGWKLKFITGRPVTLPSKDIDQVSNRDGGGWVPKGQSGSIAGTTAVLSTSTLAPIPIKSMYRNINYYQIEIGRARTKLDDDLKNGNAEGSWAVSKRWTMMPSILDSKGEKHLDSSGQTPGTGVIGATSVPRSPFVINEIGNGDGSANDWIELRNITDDVQSLKNYQLSVVTEKDGNNNTVYDKDKHKDTKLFDFHDKDYEVGPYGVVVITSTHPKNSDLAVGIDLAVLPVRSIKNDPELAGSTQAHKDMRAAALEALLEEKQDNQALKGLRHLYLVKSFNIPDSGPTLLILRNNHEGKHLGTANQIVDVVGTLRINNNTTATSLWPLNATGAPHANVIENGAEDFGAGKVYIRKANARTLKRKDLTHISYAISADGTPVAGTGEKHIIVAEYTGVGYDRLAAGNDQNGGTPGYDNRSVVNEELVRDSNGKIITPHQSVHEGIVSISEVMLATHTAPDDADRTPRATRLPQWIEIYNAHMAKTVNLEKWYLEIRNSDSEDLITRDLHGTLRLPDMNIPPNQTVLIVSSSGLSSPHFPERRVINLFTDRNYRAILSLENRNDPILSQVGFYIELRDSEGRHVDQVGNLPATIRRGVEARGTAGYTPVWDLPEMNHADGPRTSLIRIYDDGMPSDGLKPVATGGNAKGTEVGWRRAVDTTFRNIPRVTYYGNQNDYGTPGYRGGGPLPVSLSKFRPERLKETGEVVIRWITESELNNAGFNILRSETRDGEYTKINTQLIAGHGTTSERHTYEWKDTSAKPNVVYYYQIQDVSLDGRVTPLRMSRLKGNVNAAGKLSTKWAELKALQ